ncbi:unnamed protein product [Soboliphyme baturini]|uniref:Craniofacial development protein 2-like n=1 Tax=Soboliphyme baturini TaxID=241478 RepID=A0A183IP97_9BILA|nr:unnamed protein product [Soboliphyme baturini]
MGDFNAKLCRGRKVSEKYIGRFGIGKLNNRGDRMVAVTEANELFVGNTWFRKKVGRKWTWITPNAFAKNEMDYILVDIQRILKDVSIRSAIVQHRKRLPLVAGKNTLNSGCRMKATVSYQRKRPMEIDEAKMERQVGTTNWNMRREQDPLGRATSRVFMMTDGPRVFPNGTRGKEDDYSASFEEIANIGTELSTEHHVVGDKLRCEKRCTIRRSGGRSNYSMKWDIMLCTCECKTCKKNDERKLEQIAIMTAYMESKRKLYMSGLQTDVVEWAGLKQNGSC